MSYLRAVMLSRCLGFLLLVVITICGCARERQTALYVAAAANVKDAIQEIIEGFEQETGSTVALIVNSSGNITTQIEQGLPVDLFVSADMQYPMNLYERGYSKAPPQMYCQGRLVILSGREDLQPSFESMTSDPVRKIAIANPKVAPYGRKAKLALENAGVFEAIQSKLVYGTSVSQAKQFADAGAAEIAITARSLIDEDDHWALIPDNLYGPLAQGMILIDRKEQDQDLAVSLWKYILSPGAQAVLRSYGFTTNYIQ